MGIVLNKPGRGRTVIRKTANNNPRKGLTARMMMKTNKEVALPLRNIKSLRILNMKRGSVTFRGKKHKGLKFFVKDSEKTTPRDKIKKHETLIMMQEPASSVPEGALFSDKNRNLIVSCSCEFHLYFCEYALTHYSASFIKYSNGKPPLTTNSGLIPFTCKHVHVCLAEILLKNI